MNIQAPWIFPTSSTVSFNCTQPMQVTIDYNPNCNYHAIAKDFLEKYALHNLLGIFSLIQFYNTESMISLRLHQNQITNLTEIIGFNNFKNKLEQMGINTIRYHSINFTTQPVGKNNVLITFLGKAEINGLNYAVESTLVVRLINNTYRIKNHIMNIFL